MERERQQKNSLADRYFMGEETVFALCVSTAFAPKTLPLPCVFQLPSWLRHCLCLVCFNCLRG